MMQVPGALLTLWTTYGKIVRYVISGGTAATVHFAVLIFLVEAFGLYPVYASVGAFLVAVVVSFLLQKLWTFKNFERVGAPRQALTYFLISATNLIVNAGLMYLFIEQGELQYLLAQVLTSGLIALESFFLYKHLVFAPPAPPTI